MASVDATMRGGSALGQDDPPDQAPVRGADGAGRGDVAKLPDPEELGPGETGNRRPADDADGDGGGGKAGAEQAQHDHGEQEGRQDLEELGEPHQQFVDETAVKPGGGADPDAEDHGDRGGDRADGKGGAPAMDDPGQHVAAHDIRTERYARTGARRGERRPHDLEGIDRVEGGQDEGDREHRRQQEEPHDRRAVAEEPRPGLAGGAANGGRVATGTVGRQGHDGPPGADASAPMRGSTIR